MLAGRLAYAEAQFDALPFAKPETPIVVVRAVQLYRSARSAQLRLFRANEEGNETLLATSSPVPKAAAASVLAARCESRKGRTGDDYLITRLQYRCEHKSSNEHCSPENALGDGNGAGGRA